MTAVPLTQPESLRFAMFDWLDESGRGQGETYEERLRMLDVDTVPTGATLESLREIFISIAPALADLPMLGLGSASSFIYNATTGATINATFITSAQGLNGSSAALLDGNNHLFVANYNINSVGEYDATTGATIATCAVGDPSSSTSPLIR